MGRIRRLVLSSLAVAVPSTHQIPIFALEYHKFQMVNEQLMPIKEVLTVC